MSKIVELPCDCCGNVYRIKRTNLDRIVQAIQLRYHGGIPPTLDLGAVPVGIDLEADLSAKDIARIVRAAVEFKGR